MRGDLEEAGLLISPHTSVRACLGLGFFPSCRLRILERFLKLCEPCIMLLSSSIMVLSLWACVDSSWLAEADSSEWAALPWVTVSI